MAEEYLTIEEIATRLKLKPKTVREWLRLGRLPGIKAGRLWRVREEDLQAFLQRHQGPQLDSHEQ